jgi:hypothetical protein
VKGNDGSVSTIKIEGQDDANKSISKYSDYIKDYGGLYIKEESIFIYDFQSMGGVYIKGCVGTALNAGSVEKEIEAFHKHADSIIAIGKAKADELVRIENERIAAIRLKEYGLADKDVVKIEVVDLNIPNKLSHHKPFSFELEATLKDGRKIRTGGSKGYSSDYTVTYKEGKINYAGLGVGVMKHDEIVIQVTLKSKPSIKTVRKIAINYDAAITWNWNAHHGGYKQAGSSAENLKLEIKQVKHTVTGEKLLMVRLSNLSTGSLIDEVKIGINETMYLYCNGGDGDVEDGKGYNGGHGGDILVVKDPNVSSYNLKYSNNYGNGGSGVYSIGRDGQSGIFKEEVKAVNFF